MRKKFQCKHCDFIGNSGGEMSGHSRRVHPGMGRKAKAKIIEETINIQYCPGCGMKFRDVFKMKVEL